MTSDEPGFQDGQPSPQDLARTGGLVPSSGASGDLPIDDTLADLHGVTENFLTGRSEEHDAVGVVQAGSALHDVLQRRLDEAAG